MRFDRIYIFRTVLLIVCISTARVSFSEPLRIFVPLVSDKESMSTVVSMSIYLEMIKAFSGSRNAERGAWVLYGRDPLSDASRRAALSAAQWPSVWADIVAWGEGTRLGDTVVVDAYIARTRISKTREVRPDVLVVKIQPADVEYNLSLANSAAFFDLEPFSISMTELEPYYDQSRGFPVYFSVNSDIPDTFTENVIYILEVLDNIARIRFENDREGWIKFPQLPHENLSIIRFSRGLVQVLRGDWIGAVNSFTNKENIAAFPNALQIDAHIYLGIARYKLGKSGLEDFRVAYSLNEFSKDAASFLMVGLLLDYMSHKESIILDELEKRIVETQVLFSDSDRWFNDLRLVVKELR